ncbi:MAG: cyclase family protein [Lachnospiraceae bacterium]|nr:cyclase family protein [Lachnospiraceae bacterium]
MEAVYELNGLRVIDLTKPLDPATETRRCHLFRFNTGGPIPDFHTIMDLTSHLGTHVECPYHHSDDWPDVAHLPLTAFMGRAIYVNITDMEPYTHITAADLERNCGSRIKEGDIVILDSPNKLPPFTPATNGPEDKRLLIGEESALWFRDKKVKCVGFGDGVSIENCNEDVKPFHDILMAENITFLEVLKNLDQLKSDTFFMSYSPLPITGLDSCPVRVYAIEGIAQFS